MRIISAIMTFYWSHPIALQKLSNERSYKFSWILTQNSDNMLLRIYCSLSVSISADESTVHGTSGVKPHEAPKKHKNCKPDNDDW